MYVHSAFSSTLCYCTAELLSSLGCPSYFSFSLAWDHTGEKKKFKKLHTTSPLKAHNRFTPKNTCILLGRVSTKPV